MKHLIKLLSVAALFSLAVNANAQTFGIKAGANFANMLVEDDSDTYSDDYKSKAGLLVGATFEMPFSDMFSLETGLAFSQKGFKMEDSESQDGYTAEGTSKTTINYLDLPITAKLRFNVGDKTDIYCLAGPYLGFALSGKQKYEYTVKMDGETIADESEEEDLEIGSDEENDDIKMLDLGLQLGAGVEFNKIQIGVTYGLGLGNISPYTENGATIKNKVFGVSVAYLFKK